MSRIGGRGPGSRIHLQREDKGKEKEADPSVAPAIPAISEVTLQPPAASDVCYLQILPEELLVEIFLYALSDANGLANQWTAAALRLTCRRFNTLLTSSAIQKRLLLPVDDQRLLFRLVKTTPEDKVVTFLPYCWTVRDKNYALAVPATGTMNKFFIGIVTIDIDGNIEFIDEEAPSPREDGVPRPLIRPKYDHVDGRVAATLAERNGYIFVATRPVPRYEAGPVELWRFDLAERQWALIDTWELDILWGASMSILFDETVLLLVGGMSMVSTSVECYLYLLNSRMGYGVVSQVSGKAPPVQAHKAYPIHPTPDQDPLTERILILGTATGHQNHDGNLHYHLELTWGSGSGSKIHNRRHTLRFPTSGSRLFSNRKSQAIRSPQTDFHATWSKLHTKFAPPQRGRAQCAGIVPDGQMALVHSYGVLGQREPPSLIALNLRTWIWSEVNLAHHQVERHPHSGGSNIQSSNSHSSVNGPAPVMWSCLPCQGLLVLNDGTEWRVALLNSDFGRASLSFLRSERIVDPSLQNDDEEDDDDTYLQPTSSSSTSPVTSRDRTPPPNTTRSWPSLRHSSHHRHCSIQ